MESGPQAAGHPVMGLVWTRAGIGADSSLWTGGPGAPLTSTATDSHSRNDI